MSEALEEGYKHLANDTEMYTRRRFEHHCGFDFSDGMPTAVCNCGAVATTLTTWNSQQELPKQLWDEAVAYGKALENERIIELLEDNCTCIEECYCTFIKAVDLIKGEQK